MEEAGFFVVIALTIFVMGFILGAIVGVDFWKKLSHRPEKMDPKIFKTWLLTLGIVMLALGASFAAYSTYFIAASKTAEGAIIGIEKKVDDEGAEYSYPVYAFEVEDGEEYKAVSSDANLHYEIGDHASIRYLPNNPERSRIDAFTSHWINPMLLMASGVFILMFFLVYSWMYREKPANKESLG
ncbi:Protein of unknown function [Desulfatibacillum alkenivorans DSM 16219]|jgi:hypothetical protein|uniref:DUF3592 domain-containing protein n=1 Tax=Desulfatibacillum alkenivorans DSM 16219 TaxID=1121393 RepID=A0A1M6YZ48_9BACT|nr:DUF3592 domain-containing protein [Desulfatibacillum alkenivorans]SHL23551.1 Protein of unknown function [Desulfatibacillum alkenivorans DSM 16219]